MKQRLSILGVVAVVAASLWAAAPAKAADGDVCHLMLAEPNVVEIGPGQINVYPSNVGPYATYLVAAARAWVNCIYAENAGPVVACVNEVVANRPTVTIDPITLQITIDYSGLFNTACQL